MCEEYDTGLKERRSIRASKTTLTAEVQSLATQPLVNAKMRHVLLNQGD
jgi:hypothetical protein